VANEVVAVKDLAALREMITQLDIEASMPGEVVFDVETFMDRILSAETPVEVFENQLLAGYSSKDYIDTPFHLRGSDITWVRTSVESSAFPFYARIVVTDDATGEEKTINGGGNTFVAALYRLQRLGFFNLYPDPGAPLMLVAKTTASGNTVVMFKPLGAPPKSSANAKK